MGRQESRPLLCSRRFHSRVRLPLFLPINLLYTLSHLHSCQAYHLPPYIKNRKAFTDKGVDIVATIASNDSWVMNAWGKVNGVKGDEVLFLSDTKTFFSKEHGWAAGMGDRNGRWAMVFDHGKVVYAENEKSPGEVSVSGAEAVLAKL
jgi:alkyl hydroperoxide reductase 1